MYAIENDLGRFEGESEKEAKAKLRKAQREAHKRDQKEAADRGVALFRAQARAYRMLAHYVGSNRKTWEFPRGWRLFPIGEQHWGVRKSEDALGRAAWVVDCGSEGQATDSFHGAKPVEYVEDGAGFALALVFHDPEGSRVFHAVGVCGDQLALAEVPGIEARWFANVREYPALTAEPVAPPEGAVA